MQFVKMNFLALLMLPLWLCFAVKNREITQKSGLGLHPHACCQPQPGIPTLLRSTDCLYHAGGEAVSSHRTDDLKKMNFLVFALSIQAANGGVSPELNDSLDLRCISDKVLCTMNVVGIDMFMLNYGAYKNFSCFLFHTFIFPLSRGCWSHSVPSQLSRSHSHHTPPSSLVSRTVKLLSIALPRAGPDYFHQSH